VVQPLVERACLSASDNTTQILARDLDPEFCAAALLEIRECRLPVKASCVVFMVPVPLGRNDAVLQ
jgi:hypothetical protein